MNDDIAVKELNVAMLLDYLPMTSTLCSVADKILLRLLNSHLYVPFSANVNPLKEK